VQTREKHQVLFRGQSPIKTALLGSRETDLTPHLFVVRDAVVAMNGHAAGRRLDQRGDDLRERRFARAVASD